MAADEPMAAEAGDEANDTEYYDPDARASNDTPKRLRKGKAKAKAKAGARASAKAKEAQCKAKPKQW